MFCWARCPLCSMPKVTQRQPSFQPGHLPPLPLQHPSSDAVLVRFALQSRLLSRGQVDRCGGRRGTWKPKSRRSCL